MLKLKTQVTKTYIKPIKPMRDISTSESKQSKWSTVRPSEVCFQWMEPLNQSDEFSHVQTQS